MRATSTIKALLTLVVIATATGCAVKKDFYATGGSRADGTVDMAYDFRQFEQPVVNQQQAQSIAKSKCGVWGYNNAEPFGGKVTTCHQRNGFGDCLAGQVVVKYQCLGNIDAAVAPNVTPAQVLPAGMMTPDQYRKTQLQQLQQQGLPYEEYQARYRQIMAE